MLTQEIRSVNWKGLCDAFNSLRQNARVSLETVDHDGAHDSVAEDVQLAEMRFETNPCSTEIVLCLADDSGHKSWHTIIEPIYVRIQQDPRGSKTLKIDAENGATWMRFHSGRIEDLLAGAQANSRN